MSEETSTPVSPPPTRPVDRINLSSVPLWSSNVNVAPADTNASTDPLPTQYSTPPSSSSSHIKIDNSSSSNVGTRSSAAAAADMLGTSYNDLPIQTRPNAVRGNTTIVFPVRLDLNDKISVMCGDICRLDTDAIVASTNENLSEMHGVAGAIRKQAGPEIENEIARIETCRTGEAKICPGYNLPSRYVIFTVGPRFNPKYQTAAENALHCSYRTSMQVMLENKLQTIAFPAVHLESRNFPTEIGAHISIRTIRRFLEKHGNNAAAAASGEVVQRVVFCLERPADYAVYCRVLPLYFPRNRQEEIHAMGALPAYTGDENGETVIEERKIRIMKFPGAADSDEDEDDEDGYNNNNDYDEDDRGSSTSSTAPNISNQSSPATSPPAGRAGDNTSAGDLTRLHIDPDEEKRRMMASKTQEDIEREREEFVYTRILKNARKEDLSDIAQLNIIYQAGVDQFNRPIVVVVGHHIPALLVDMERVLMYIIRTMDPIVDREYVIVYLHSLVTSSHHPELSWLRRVHGIFDRKYSSNLKQLYVVHPTFWLKVAFTVLGTFLSPAFSSDKLRYFDRLNDLLNVLDLQQLNLPTSIYQYDAIQNGNTRSPISPPTQTKTAHEEL
eukprot:TRINITY_DN3097_c2_g1_i2.p1 TRINITY_DN3097_c2_g1~~TRINITY_DN3097_c2_g1_i2.p1  ORF type:complete len:642 (-),score=124.69 TRINITY_DN3097_c2_g1_i2:27-1865(-)